MLDLLVASVQLTFSLPLLHSLVCWCSQVFSKGGNVLMPVDTSSRMLELLLVLDLMWTQHKYVNKNTHTLYTTLHNGLLHTHTPAVPQRHFLSDCHSHTLSHNAHTTNACTHTCTPICSQTLAQFCVTYDLPSKQVVILFLE